MRLKNSKSKERDEKIEDVTKYRFRVICVHNADSCPDEKAKNYLSYEKELAFNKSARTYSACTQETKGKARGADED